MADPEIVVVDGEVLRLELPDLGLVLEVSDYNAYTRTHYFECLRKGTDGQLEVVHIDRFELASARGRTAAKRHFQLVHQSEIDRQLMRLHRKFRAEFETLLVAGDPIVLNAEDIPVEQVRWVWQGRVPRRKLVMFDGDPGLGKSMVALDIGARLSVGSGMPDGTPNMFGDEPVGTLVLSAEDDPADTYIPRWLAAGGNPKFLRFLPGVRTRRGERAVNLGDLQAIDRAMRATRARLLIVDPLMAYVPPSADSWRDESMRRMLRPIQELVADLDAGFTCIRHLTKETKRPAIYRGQASMGISGAARAGFVFGKLPTDPSGQQRAMCTLKFNIGLEPNGLAYEIAQAPGAIWPSVRWGKPVTLTADELLAGPTAERDPGDELLDACDVLRTILKDGPVDAARAYEQGSAAGVSRRTLERAKAHLGVRSVKDGAGAEGAQSWRWHAPPPRPTSPTNDESELGDVGDLGGNGRGDVGDLGDLAPTSPRSSTLRASSVGDVGEDQWRPRVP